MNTDGRCRWLIFSELPAPLIPFNVPYTSALAFDHTTRSTVPATASVASSVKRQCSHEDVEAWIARCRTMIVLDRFTASKICCV